VLWQFAVVSGDRGSLHIKDFVLPVCGTSSSFHILNQSIRDDSGNVVVSEVDHKISVAEHSNASISHGASDAQECNMIRHVSELAVGGILETRWAEFSLKTQLICDAVMESATKGGGFVDVHGL